MEEGEGGKGHTQKSWNRRRAQASRDVTREGGERRRPMKKRKKRNGPEDDVCVRLVVAESVVCVASIVRVTKPRKKRLGALSTVGQRRSKSS